MSSNPPIVEFRGVGKRFPGVTALDGIHLSVPAGSCHAVVGENGAGKSTLGKILAGIYRPDRGTLFLSGQRVDFASPCDAIRAGIGLVHQELVLCENLTVAENICLSALPHRAGFLSRRTMIERAAKYLHAVGTEVDARTDTGSLPVSRQQMVQIAAALAQQARVLVFDEPTSSLSQRDAEHLFTLIRGLCRDGITCLYVSHRLDEVLRLCDAVTVLRDGRVVETAPIGQIDRNGLVQRMIGRPLGDYFPHHLRRAPGEELLRVENLSSQGKFSGISFSLRSGEILGLAGLVGAGRTEIAEAVFGLDPAARGRVWIRGREIRLHDPAEAIALGMGLVPEDRKRHGLVLSLRARENLTLPFLRRLSRAGWMNEGQELAVAQQAFRALDLRATGVDAATDTLSGGNQQKIVVARWLTANCRVLIADEPTRGVDVGAKAEIHGILDRLAREGHGILLISSELPELIHLSTRILVLRGGRIAGEVSHTAVSQARLLRLMTGFDDEIAPPAIT